MDIRKYLVSQKPSEEHESDSDEGETPHDLEEDDQSVDTEASQRATSISSAKSAQKKVYKSRLSFRHQWKSKYPWVYCDDVQEGMFCRLCQEHGKPPPNAQGAWTSRGVCDWNHATEMLKLHSKSKWHNDAAIAARMAEQPSVLELQRSAAVRSASERRAKNKEILLKLLRSVYFLTKHRIPHTTTFQDLLALQVANGDQLLKKPLEEAPGNAQYTSTFSITSLIDATATWIDRKLVDSLRESPFFFDPCR